MPSSSGVTRLGHPVFTGAVMVLAVNDGVFKARFGGWWTGKLSDFAGVFVVAVLGGVLLRRPHVGAAATAVGFACLKLVPEVAVLAAPFLGGTTRQDATDLVAIVMVYPAAAFVEGRPVRAGSSDQLDPPVHPVQPASPVRQERSVTALVLALGGAVAAVLTISATSCVEPVGVSAFVVDDEGVVMAHMSAHDSGVGTDPSDPRSGGSAQNVDRESWAESTDGGKTWQAVATDDVLAERVATASSDSAETACSDDLGCFRVQPDETRVEQQAPGSDVWDEAYSLTSKQRRRIARVAEGCDAMAALFAAVTIVDRSDGEHVLVAMGPEGVLHRSPGGEWQPRPVLDAVPTSPDVSLSAGNGPFIPVVGLVLIGLMVLVIGGWRHGWRRGFIALGISLGGALVVLAFAAHSLTSEMAFDPVGSGLIFGMIAMLTVGVFVASLLVALVPPSRRGRPGMSRPQPGWPPADGGPWPPTHGGPWPP